MDQAIESAKGHCFSTGSQYQETHTVTKVVFKTLEANVSYRDNNFTYKFEAELAEA